MSPVLDTRNEGGVLGTRDNIVPDDSAQGLRGGTPQAVVAYVEGVDAATGASAVVTVDTGAAPGSTLAGDTGQLAVGEYAYYVEITHPSAAAANRQVLIQHRDSGNANTIGTRGTVNAGAGKQINRGKFTVETANERLRLLTGTDATNANIAVKFLVWRVE